MNTTMLDKDVKRYVDAVAAALVDLPDATRTEILEDLAAHLAEFDLANGTLDTQLGDPAIYAEELRASAGLVSPAERGAQRGTDQVAQVAASARRALSRVRATTWWRELAELRPELRPAWWVLRAWLVLTLFDGPARGNVPLPHLTDGLNGPLGFLMRIVVLGAAVLASVRLGRAQLAGHRRLLGYALSIVGVIAALAFMAQIDDSTYVPYSSVVSTNSYGIDGRGVRGVMVFDDAGRLLTQRVPALVDPDGTVIAATGEPTMVNGRMRDLMPCPDEKTYALCVAPEITDGTRPGAIVTSTTIATPTTTVAATPTTTAVAVPSTTTAAPAAPTTSVG